MPEFTIGITAVLILLGAIALYFLYCARRGVCPFPHKRRGSAKVAAAAIASAANGENTVSVAPGASAPVQLAVPLAVDDPVRNDLLRDLQGNILAGHGRDHAVHLFISFSADAAGARAWLRWFAETHVVSAMVQQATAKAFKHRAVDGGIFGHVSLSSAGYRALGFSAADFPQASNPLKRGDRQGYSDVFAAGMKARQRFLFDPEVSHWDAGYQNEIHALLILAGDSESSVNDAVDAVIASLTATVGKVVARENGMGLRRQLDPNDPSTVAHVEHFGYVDGRSQPVFLEEQLDAEKASGGITTWDPSAPLSLVLVPDPLGKNSTSCGSFLVFRKLEQNVRGWNRAVGALAGELGVQQELAGAMAMGRFKDGTPVVEQGTSGRTDVHNNFDFAGDTDGRRCPFQAHIRKTNPRGEAIGAGDSSVESERAHRIARRGIPYGGALTTSDVPEEQPEGGVGLLFFCYQGDIWEQFEFIQRRWSNNPFFLQPEKSKKPGYDATGLDPVIGQAHPQAKGAAHPAANWPKGWGNETTKVDTQLANFVTMKGGEYFFSPSMSFLRGL